MKIRLGFVSNSSSSSFVVAFPRVPRSAKDVQEMVFGDECCVYYNGSRLDAEQASHFLFSQMAAPATQEQLIDAVDGDYYEDGVSWDTIDNQNKKRSNETIENFRRKHEGILYTFEFADDNPEGRILEHGDVFHRLPHLRQSRH